MQGIKDKQVYKKENVTMIEKVKEIADRTGQTMDSVASSIYRQAEKGLPLNLQFFAEDDAAESIPSNDKKDDVQDGQDDSKGKGKDDTPKDDDKPKFTQTQVNKMIQDRVNRLERDKQKAIDEAEKLAKMNADEKREYELEKLQRENEELKAAQSRFELGKEATKMLATTGITATDEILDFVVREDAETTSEAVKSFADLVDKVSDERMKEKLKGNPPKKQPNGAKPITKQDVTKMSYSEHLEFKRTQPDLYKQIMNN